MAKRKQRARYRLSKQDRAEIIQKLKAELRTEAEAYVGRIVLRRITLLVGSVVTVLTSLVLAKWFKG